MANSLKEKTRKPIGLNVTKTFRDRLDEYVATHEGVGIVDVMTTGADIFMDGLVPVLGKIPCGPLDEAIAEARYHEVAPPTLRPNATDFYLEASGDSMEPRIEQYDYVLIRRLPGPDEFTNGDVCAVQVYENEECEGPCTATLKQVFRTDDPEIVELRAFNKAYKPIKVSTRRTVIIGTMRGLVRRSF